VEVVASLSQGRTSAAQCGLFTHKSVPVIFEPPCIYDISNLRVNAHKHGLHFNSHSAKILSCCVTSNICIQLRNW